MNTIKLTYSNTISEKKNFASANNMANGFHYYSNGTTGLYMQLTDNGECVVNSVSGYSKISENPSIKVNNVVVGHNKAETLMTLPVVGQINVVNIEQNAYYGTNLLADVTNVGVQDIKVVNPITFWLDYFDYENNVAVDKSEFGNDAQLVQSNCVYFNGTSFAEKTFTSDILYDANISIEYSIDGTTKLIWETGDVVVTGLVSIDLSNRKLTIGKNGSNYFTGWVSRLLINNEIEWTLSSGSITNEYNRLTTNNSMELLNNIATVSRTGNDFGIDIDGINNINIFENYDNLLFMHIGQSNSDGDQVTSLNDLSPELIPYTNNVFFKDYNDSIFYSLQQKIQSTFIPISIVPCELYGRIAMLTGKRVYVARMSKGGTNFLTNTSDKGWWKVTSSDYSTYQTVTGTTATAIAGEKIYNSATRKWYICIQNATNQVLNSTTYFAEEITREAVVNYIEAKALIASGSILDAGIYFNQGENSAISNTEASSYAELIYNMFSYMKTIIARVDIPILTFALNYKSNVVKTYTTYYGKTVNLQKIKNITKNDTYFISNNTIQYVDDYEMLPDYTHYSTSSYKLICRDSVNILLRKFISSQKIILSSNPSIQTTSEIQLPTNFYKVGSKSLWIRFKWNGTSASLRYLMYNFDLQNGIRLAIPSTASYFTLIMWKAGSQIINATSSVRILSIGDTVTFGFTWDGTTNSNKVKLFSCIHNDGYGISSALATSSSTETSLPTSKVRFLDYYNNDIFGFFSLDRELSTEELTLVENSNEYMITGLEYYGCNETYGTSLYSNLGNTAFLSSGVTRTITNKIPISNIDDYKLQTNSTSFRVVPINISDNGGWNIIENINKSYFYYCLGGKIKFPQIPELVSLDIDNILYNSTTGLAKEITGYDLINANNNGYLNIVYDAYKITEINLSDLNILHYNNVHTQQQNFATSYNMKNGFTQRGNIKLQHDENGVCILPNIIGDVNRQGSSLFHNGAETNILFPNIGLVDINNIRNNPYYDSQLFARTDGTNGLCNTDRITVYPLPLEGECLIKAEKYSDMLRTPCLNNLTFWLDYFDYDNGVAVNKIEGSDGFLVNSNCLSLNVNKIICGDISKTQNPLLSAYIRPTNISGFRFIYERRSASSTQREYALYMDAGKLSFAVWHNDTTLYACTATLALSTNIWYEVKGWYDRSQAKIFCAYRTCPSILSDGFGVWVIKELACEANLILKNATKTSIGGVNWSTGSDYIGQICNLQINDYLTNTKLNEFCFAEGEGTNAIDYITKLYYPISGIITSIWSIKQNFYHINISRGFDLWVDNLINPTKYLRSTFKEDLSSVFGEFSSPPSLGFIWKTRHVASTAFHNNAETQLRYNYIGDVNIMQLTSNQYFGNQLFTDDRYVNGMITQAKKLLEYIYIVGRIVNYTPFDLTTHKKLWDNCLTYTIKYDGSGDYPTIREATQAQTGLIYVKINVEAGTYNELDIILKNKVWLNAVGDVTINGDGTQHILSPADYYYVPYRNKYYDTEIPNAFKHVIWQASNSIRTGFTCIGKDVKYVVHGDDPAAFPFIAVSANNVNHKVEVSDIESGSVNGIGLWSGHKMVFINETNTIDRGVLAQKDYQCGVFMHNAANQANECRLIIENCSSDNHILKFNDLLSTNNDMIMLYNCTTGANKGIYVAGSGAANLWVLAFGSLFNIYNDSRFTRKYLGVNKMVCATSNWNDAYLDDFEDIQIDENIECLNTTLNYVGKI